MHRFASVAVVDPRGRILMQERDEHAPVSPEQWCLPGGGLEGAETFRQAAARELAEETGLQVAPEDLESLGVISFFSQECADDDEFELFLAALPVDDRDVVCGEGRQMVFVDPLRVPGLDLVEAARRALDRLLSSEAYSRASSVHVSDRRFAGVLLVDTGGRILLQERDEHPVIDPEKWGLVGGHVDPGEDVLAAAHRELAEETGVEIPPGGLSPWRELVVDHRHAYGTWDRMAVFAASTSLDDSAIDCREGRRIVFVDPGTARGLDLSSAAADIVPAFLDSALYATMSP